MVLLLLPWISSSLLIGSASSSGCPCLTSEIFLSDFHCPQCVKFWDSFWSFPGSSEICRYFPCYFISCCILPWIVLSLFLYYCQSPSWLFTLSLVLVTILPCVVTCCISTLNTRSTSMFFYIISFYIIQPYLTCFYYPDLFLVKGSSLFMKMFNEAVCVRIVNVQASQPLQ